MLKNIENKKIFTALMAGAVATSGIATVSANEGGNLPSDFDQVPTYAKSTIEELYNQNKLSGFADGTFKPLNELTRAEYVAMILRAYGFDNAPDKANVEFTDEDSMTSFQLEVMSKAFQVGLINGTAIDADGKIKADPSKKITREEMAAILVKANDIVVGNEALTADEVDAVLAVFTKDANEVSDWAKGAVATAINENLIHGTSSVSLSPKNIGTRVDSALLLGRLADKVTNLPTSLELDAATNISDILTAIEAGNAGSRTVVVDKLGEEVDVTSLNFENAKTIITEDGVNYGLFLIKTTDTNGVERFITIKVKETTPEVIDGEGTLTGTDGVVDEEITTPVVDEEITTPVVDEEVTTPVVDEEITTPVVDEEVTTPVVDEEVTTPVVDEEVTTPVVDEEVTTPVVDEEITTPVVDEEVTTPVVDEEVTAPNFTLTYKEKEGYSIIIDSGESLEEVYDLLKTSFNYGDLIIYNTLISTQYEVAVDGDTALTGNEKVFLLDKGLKLIKNIAIIKEAVVEPEATEPEVIVPTEPEATEPTEPEVIVPTEPVTPEPTEPEVIVPTEPVTPEPTEPEVIVPTEPVATEPTEPVTPEPTV